MTTTEPLLEAEMRGCIARMMEQVITAASQGEIAVVVTPDEQTATQLRAEYRMACEILGDRLRIQPSKKVGEVLPNGGWFYEASSGGPA